MTRFNHGLVVILILLAAGLMSGADVFSGRPLETHEDFVAQTSREKLATGDPLVPTFGGERRLEKPPLMYWVVAGLGLAAGERDIPAWVARAPSMVATVFLAWAAIAIGALVYDRRTALLSGGIFATCVGVFAYGGNARPEMIYAALTTASLYGFLRASTAWVAPARVDRPPESVPLPRSTAWLVFAWIAFALAILAKGPQLPALVLGGWTVWLVHCGGWRGWARATAPLLGLAVVTAVAAPWFVLVALREDGALAFWSNQLVGLRFKSDGAGGGVLLFLGRWLLEFIKPDYLVHLVHALLPWGLLLPAAFVVPWVRRRPDLARGRVLFWSVVVPVFVLSLVPHSRSYYLLPILVPSVVLLARGVLDLLDKAMAQSEIGSRCVAGLWTLAVFPILALVAAEIYLHSTGRAVGDPTSKAIVAAAVALIVLASLVAVLRLGRSARAGTRGQSRARAYRGLAAIVVTWTWVGFAAALDPSLWSNRDRRVDAFATLVAERAAAGLPVYTLDFNRSDLIYELNRQVQTLPDTTTVEDLESMPRGLLVTTTERLDELVARGFRVEYREPFLIEDDTFAEVVELGRVR